MTPHSKPALGRPKDPEKRQAILQAAAELFPSKGFDGVSMMEIAERAKVSKITLYSHFTDKEDLFTQAVIDCCEQQLPASSFQPAPGLDIEQALTVIGIGFLELALDEKAITLHRMIVRQGGMDTGNAELYFKVGPARMLAEMRHFLEHAGRSGALDIPQPERAAEHFFCLLKGLVYMRVLMGLCPPPDRAARESHVREVVALFMAAYRPGNRRAQ